MADDDGTPPAPKRPRSQKRKQKEKAVSPNEGILEMLSEIEENAKGHLATSIRRAKKSIAACPLPIRSGEDAGRIKYVGDFLKTRIAAYLAKHPVDDAGFAITAGAAAGPSGSAAPEVVAPTRKKREEYVPRYRSGPYAILLGLLTAEGDGQPHLNKYDVGAMAEPFAEEPIHDKKGVSKSTKYAYNGWSSVSRTLIPKGLVLKSKNPAQYALTEKGRALAVRLRDNLGQEANIVTTFSPNAPRIARAASASNGNTVPPTSAANGRNAPVRSRKKKADAAPSMDENAPPSANATPNAAAAFDPAQVMLATQVVAALQREGHPAQQCTDALKAVLEGGNIPSSEPVLRVLILHKIACAEEASAARKAASGRGGAALPAPAASNGLVVGDSEDESETMDLVSLTKPDPARSSTKLAKPPASAVPASKPAADTGSTGVADMVILVLDSRERLGTGKRETCEAFAERIRALSVPVDIKTLPVGDAVFVRRCATKKGRDTMLDFVVERKAAADFASSVADGRILRQSFSMQNSLFTKRLFVIEGSLDTLDVTKPERERLEDTAVKLSMHYGFYVKYTRNTAETVAFYEELYRRMQKDLSESVGDEEGFDEWHKRMTHFNTKLGVGQMWELQLSHIPGINAEQAKSIFDMGIINIHIAKDSLRGLSEKAGKAFLKDEAKRRGGATFSALASKHFYALISAYDEYDTEHV